MDPRLLTVFFGLIHGIGLLFIYSLIAYALVRLQWHQRGVIGVLITIVVAALFSTLSARVAAPWLLSCNFIVTPFAIVFFCQKAKRIPRQREDLARLDGCGWLRIYWHVLLPCITRELILLGLLLVVGLLFPFWQDLCFSIWNNPPIVGVAITYAVTTTLTLIVVFLIARRCLMSDVPEG